ncbi:MAG: DUF2071 domain-containing protein [Acidobacteriota bacterium]|nr:DUF2071 domain-containing protein [Acidobacteriota bacterium]
MKKFLTAKWQDLVMANYEIEPSLLAEFVPKETEIDFYEGKCYASLVAFKFLNAKVLGVSVPFHANFEEVNLRFYVRRKVNNEIRRGVVFVKEIVPRRAISIVARTFYGEPYETWTMRHERSENRLAYFWSKAVCQNRISVEIGENLDVPAENSHGEFIIEHYWGYTKRGAARTDEYKVEHPKWNLFAVGGAKIDVDFDFTYGKKFAFLSAAQPETIFLARGSEISVYKGEKIN